MRARTIALLVIAAAGLAALAWFWRTIAKQSQGFFGFYNGGGNGSHYLFWSGSGSDLAYLSMGAGAITSAVVLYKHHNCHEPHCWRIGRVKIDDRGTLSCWHHHPDGKPTSGHIHRAHADYQKRLHLYLGKQPGHG